MNDTNKKGSGFIKFLKIALIVAAIAFIAYKVYQKFFKKKIEVIGEDEDNTSAVEAPQKAMDQIAAVEDAPFEVSADAVIDNAENMN